MAGKHKKKKGNQNTNITINAWACLRDIGQHAISKGQLPTLGVILFLMLIVYRMPPVDISKLVFQVCTIAHANVIGSYVANVLLAVLFVWHSRNLRRTFSSEVHRIADMKTKFQKRDLGDNLIEGSKV